MTNWRERLRLVNPGVARDAALHGLPDRIDDLSPVAVVRNGINDTSGRVWAQVRSELVFRPEFEPALGGLAGFSHLFVIGWMGDVTDEGRALLKLHPSRAPETLRRSACSPPGQRTDRTRSRSLSARSNRSTAISLG